MAKIHQLKVFGADLAGQRFDLLMRQFQELIEQAELIRQLERRRMNCVAAEVAEEIGVLLQHENPNPRARQQEPKHHPSGAAAGDAALRRNCRVGHLCSAPPGIVRQPSRSQNAEAGVAFRPEGAAFERRSARSLGASARKAVLRRSRARITEAYSIDTLAVYAEAVGR
jgi:hypothetical protein